MGNDCTICEDDYSDRKVPNLNNPSNSKLKNVRTQIFQMPSVSNHIMSKIEELAPDSLKKQNQNKKIWKLTSPYNLIYRNQVSDDEDIPDGLCTIYKFKDNSDEDFAGFFYGEIKHGRPVNNGSIYIFHNGSYYKGTSQNQGIYTNEKTSLKYVGQWQDNAPQGRGTETTPTGNYIGEFVKGKKCGNGVFVWEDGVKYEGGFFNNIPQGIGQYTDDRANLYYKGQIKNGQKHGHGVEKFNNGQTIYDGTFSEGKRHGQGVLTTSQGVYDGEFYNNFPHGRGSFKAKTGKEVKGLWERGQLKSVF